MKIINVIPHESLNGIQLEWTRKELHEKFGLPNSSFDGIDYYQNQEFISVHFDSNEKIEYIEISNQHSKSTKVQFNGIDIFNSKAENLITQLKNEFGLNFDTENPESNYSFVYSELDLSFWRQIIPESETDEDGMFFDTAGIGRKGYYSK